jgi:hypothetical protein
VDFSSLFDIIKTDSSRAIIDIAANYIGTDENRLEEVIQLAVSGKYPINMRAARVVEFSAQRNKAYIAKRLDFIIKQSSTSKNDGVKRAFIKVTEAFLPNEIADDLLGLVINNCFEKLNGIEAVAVKYYAINCLMKILKKEPDIKNELLISLQDQLGKNTVAFDRYMKKKITILEAK